MPELPEVETIRQDLSRKILHKKIKAVVINKKKLVKNPIALFKSKLTNSSIEAINRRGKLLIFTLTSKKDFLLVHLKMTGQLIYKTAREVIAGGHEVPALGALPNKFTHIIIEFSNHSRLYFNDLRQFGFMQIVNEPQLQKILNKYGIEPLTKNFTYSNFIKAISQRKKSIKAVLLDQNIIAGLGNIYADEVLFLAALKPSRRADRLTSSEIARLYKAINPLIKKAIIHRGTTFNNYVDAKGRQGNFSRLLKVFHKQGKPCLRCGKIIKKIRVAGRGTHYCPNCQK